MQLIGEGLTLSPLGLRSGLFAILAGSAFVGMTVRRLVRSGWHRAARRRINGVNILVLFVFVAGGYESVASRFLAANRCRTVGLAALAFIVYFAVLGLTASSCPCGRERAFVLGLMASQRNMGSCRRDGRGVARLHVAIFRSLPVSHLSWRHTAPARWPGC